MEGGKIGMNEIKTQNEEDAKREIREERKNVFWVMTPCSLECRSISTLKMMVAYYSETLVSTVKDYSVTT
jgi:hypothetical protein